MKKAIIKNHNLKPKILRPIIKTYKIKFMFKKLLIGNFAVIPALPQPMSCDYDGEYDALQNRCSGI